MKRKTITCLISSIIIISGTGTFAQESGGDLHLTLKQAQDYAVANNKAVKSAKLDLQSSRSALWETISAALPQLEGTGSFTDNLMLMTTLLPGEFFGQPG